MENDLFILGDTNLNIDISPSHHQLTFWARKIKRIKTNNPKQISFRPLKNHTMENNEREFSYVNSTNSDLANKITQVINILFLIKLLQ